MKHIDVDEDVYRELEQLATAWHTTTAGALARLITVVATGATAPGTRPPRRPAPIAVHGLYAGTRIEARFEPDTHALTIDSGPLSGQRHTSPSGARRAVVSLLNPGVSPAGNGWDFWRITATGATLRTVRDQDADR